MNIRRNIYTQPYYRLLGYIMFSGFNLLFSQMSDIHFENIGVADGLSSNFAISITQDKFGFIWIGTNNGLNRYDGYNFTTFWHDPEDSTSISGNWCEKVIVDKEGYLWIGTTSGLNLFDYSSETFTRYQHDPTDSLSLANDVIRCMYVDSENILWLGIEEYGLDRFDRETGTFRHYRHNKNNPQSLSDDNVRRIYEDNEGALWIGTGGPLPTDHGGLNRFDKATETFTRYLANPEDEQSFMENRVWGLLEDSQGSFWVGTWGTDGLHQMNRSNGTFLRFSHDSTNPNRYSTPRLRKSDPSDPGFGTGITNIYQDYSGILWITAFLGGLDRFDLKTGAREHYEANRKDPNSLGLNWVFGDIYEDRQNTLWLTSAGNGIYKVLKGAFQHYQHSTLGLNIQTIWEDKVGNIWVGTDKGLYYVDQSQKKLTSEIDPLLKSLNKESIQAITEGPNGEIWVGTKNGLYQLNMSTRKVKHHQHNPSDKHSISNNDITILSYLGLGKKNKTLWFVSRDNVLHRYDDILNHFIRYPIMESDSLLDTWNKQNQKIISLYEDSEGKIWMGSTAAGFFNWNPIDQKINVFQNGFSWALSFHEDSKGKFWVSSRLLGLVQLNTETGDFIQKFDERSGLSSARINGIMEDEYGFFWLSNMDGYISKFDPETGLLKDFGEKDGLKKNSFLPRSFLTCRNGYFLFGGLQGLTAFDPQAFQENPFPPEIVIDKILINGKTIRVIDKQEIELPHDENDLTFQFAALHYTRPEENQVLVQLEGYDQDWQKANHQSETRYTNLSPGIYTFKVKAASSDHIWSEKEATLSIIIHSPWWATWWAYILYFGIICFLLYMGYSYQKKRWFLQASLQIEQTESKRLKELNEFKSRFYANITHEFRTPLTVIQGLADEIEENPRWKTTERIKRIKNNSHKLLQLINQMLDLSKLEAGKLDLAYVQGDIIKYLNYLIESFHSLAFSRKVSLSFFSHADKLVMDYDPEKLQQIISNLVSNSLKFTPKYGKITVSAQKNEDTQKWLIIEVKDTGVGIPADKLPFIFDRFFQVDNSTIRRGEGTGLGLALVKELLDLMGGDIKVESEVSKGTSFIIKLPIRNEADLDKKESSPLERPLGEGVEKPLMINKPEINLKTDKPVVLLVENNQDVIYYLRNCLSSTYQILEANDGQTGIDIAIKTIPDLIISDVMMPEVDGFELCQTLKSDERTNHIPIILLTAKVSQTDKIEGLIQGADAYLAKPFQKEELLIRLENLLELRKRIHQKYTKPQAHTLAKDSLLRKIDQILESRLGDPDFGVIPLSRALGMSRVQVHRKLKALTGISTSEYLRNIRLQKAHELLKDTDFTISEICFQVGFKDPAHFSRTFSKHFGIPPSETRK